MPGPIQTVTRPGEVKQMQSETLCKLGDHASKGGGVEGPSVDEHHFRTAAEAPMREHPVRHAEVIVRANKLGTRSSRHRSVSGPILDRIQRMALHGVPPA